LDAEATFVHFLDEGGQGVTMIGGFGAGDLRGVPPSFVFATLAACYYAAFSSNGLTCVNVAFSHARASRWSALMLIMPFGVGIFIVA
jgi:hypothetical protein